ncbi:TonB-dependent receptor [Horticoccus sp. 23ND18S-11]|uniref:TonB-dependent receptor n=1 Tax=Horticoccus sp. 23ND18S-11 TaxID=3391832 RepID=UPI0039C8F08D
MNSASVSTVRLPRASFWRHAIVFLATLCGATAFAQSTGTLSGIVTDKATSGYLVGAEVRIAGTALATATARDGTFSLGNVPAGRQNLEVSYVGRKTKVLPVTIAAGGTTTTTVDLAEGDVLMLEAVTVESVREGQSRAINQQRTSNTVMNVISSDAIGNLPDNTVGDALARLAGVTVVTEGRSAFASIRGAEAKLNSVTLDGSHVSFPATDGVTSVGGTETRAVDLSTIPSDMISSIEVIKALPADRDADAFGGQVNLVTRSAFDLPGRSINGRAEYRYNSLRKDDGFAFSLNYSDVVDQARTLGVTATLSYSKEKYGQNDYEIPYFDKSIAPVDTIAGITNQAISEFDLRYRDITKESLGGNLNFDYRPVGPSQFYLKLFHNGSKTQTWRWRLRERGFAAFAANSTDLLASGAEARIRRLTELQLNDRTNDRIAIGGKTKLADSTLSYEVNYGEAEMDGQAQRYQFETASAALRRTIDWTVNRRDPHYPVVTMTQRATGANMLFVTQDLALNQVRFTDVLGKDEDLVAKLDYDFNQRVAETPVQWKVGAKYRAKERSLDGTMNDFVPVVAPRQNTFGGNFEPRNLFAGRVATLGPFPSLAEVLSNVASNPSNYVLTPGDESTIVAISRYTAKEKISSAFGMGTVQLGKLQAIGGLRFEKTEVDYIYRPTPATRASGSSSYDNLFPSALFNYRFNRDVVLRAAWTNTLTRPDYGDLIPYESNLDPEAVANLDSGALVKIFRGNPNLKAQKSMNYDLSLEWYYQPTGMLSVSVFHKSISDFIYKAVTRESRPPVTVALYQNKNGGDQEITGTELTWVQSLSMLPSPFNGFGFSMNATFIEGESEFPTFNVTTGATGSVTENFIPLQPKRVYNAQVYWEKYGFTARVAVNYIDEFVRDVGGISGSVTNYDATRWDAQLSYRVNRNFTVFVEGKNLGKETKRWYNGSANRPEDLDYIGWDGAAGVRFRF